MPRVRANYIGIAPRSAVTSSSFMCTTTSRPLQEGDLLFVIDPRPNEIALERARATLALTRTEVDALKSGGTATAVAGVSRAGAQLEASAAEVNRREMDPVAADAEIARLKAQSSVPMIT